MAKGASSMDHCRNAYESKSSVQTDIPLLCAVAHGVVYHGQRIKITCTELKCGVFVSNWCSI